MNAEDLRAAWIALAAEAAPAGKIRMSRLDIEVPAGPLYAALDASNEPHLLIPVPNGTPAREDTKSAAVTITRSERIVQGDRLQFIDIACHEQSLVDLFGRLTAEVVGLVRDETDSYLTAAYLVLDRWRQLLGQRRAGISRDELLGLFAELVVLERTVSGDPSRRIDHWHGPERDRHDFRRSGLAVEVKATAAREGVLVSIHGVEQLDIDPGCRLALAVLSLEEHEEGRTVDDVVRSIAAMGADETGLMALAQSTGWRPTAHTERFRVRHERWYEVDDDFPKITPATFGGTVPPGVLHITYSVDLSGPAPEFLSQDQVADIVDALATGA